MEKIDKRYENFEATLTSVELNSRKELHEYLKSHGWSSLDDFYFLKRTDKSEKWQAEDLASLSVFNRGNDIYETEEGISEDGATHWDSIRLSYLLASHPSENNPVFLSRVNNLAQEFSLKIIYQGQDVSIGQLEIESSRLSDSLKMEYAVQGSKDLAIYIAMTYQN